MKYTLFTLLLVATIATTSKAQFGFEGGVNFANLAIKSNGDKVKTTYKIGPSIGIVAGMHLDAAEHVYFEPGFFYQSNGAKVTGKPTGKYFINSISIPLNFEYRTGERCGERFIFGIGPYVADNLSGSYKFDAYGPIQATSGTIKIQPETDYQLKQWEVGLGLSIGYLSKKHFFLRGHYQMGFTNLYPNADSKNSFKQSAFGLTIGYMIVRCNKSRSYRGYGVRGRDHWRGVKKNKWSTKQSWRRPNGPGL
jgi:Outer membrane protein beta-barrel domain